MYNESCTVNRGVVTLLTLPMSILQDSLGGNAKTHMIACVHPGAR